jgi:hypothetical protein
MKAMNKRCLSALAAAAAGIVLMPTASAFDKDQVHALKEKASAPISSFFLNDRGASWEAVAPRWLLVQDISGKTWLLKTGQCPGLPNGKDLRITTRGKSVEAGKDMVNHPGRPDRCVIEEIRTVSAFNRKVGVPGMLLVGERPNLPPTAF